MKLNINYRGDVSLKDQSFNYTEGVEVKDLLMDPDLMTWSIFENFCKENGVNGEVEANWYKLPQENNSSTRVIGADKDDGIRELSREAVIGGEVDIYIDNDISVPAPFSLRNRDDDDEVNEEGVDDDEEIDEETTAETNGYNQGLQDDGKDPIKERMHDNPRFEAFYEEIHNGTEAAEAMDEESNKVPEDTVVEESDDEDEFETQCCDAERPDHAMGTDDEWDAYDQAERVSSRKKFSKDKSPYLWMLQNFNSGEEFKDQLLRYVLTINYDVKLCRWGATKLTAICSHDSCNWKIYYFAHKRTWKWIVQTYFDEHHHSKSGKARILKQGMFRDEERRRPCLRWTDIKDEIMMRYTLSMSKWICLKARILALDMVIETQKV